jgi:hypothetical protein
VTANDREGRRSSGHLLSINSKRKTANELVIESQYGERQVKKFNMQFLRHAQSPAHKQRVNALKCDTARNLILSCGSDKLLNISEITSGTIKVISKLKTANAKLKALEVNSTLKRLYASSYEG